MGFARVVRVSCTFAVPRGTGTGEARHVAGWTHGLARSENPAPPTDLMSHLQFRFNVCARTDTFMA